jgi:putative FmdB family regulatory protein
MPIYEYQCAACGRTTEWWQKFSEAPLKTCPHCGGCLTKLISSCAFHLKGSGWYATDYAGSQPASVTAGKTEEARDSQDSPGSEAGKDAAPAPEKPEAPPPPICK